MPTIAIRNAYSPEELEDMNQLVTALRDDSGKSKGKARDLKTMLADPNTVLVAARDNKHIIGIGTLYSIQKLGMRVGYVEDIVVKQEYRGAGLGRKILEKLIAVGRKKRLDSIRLSSKPSRIAANKLYQRLGFKKRDTNAYKLEL